MCSVRWSDLEQALPHMVHSKPNLPLAPQPLFLMGPAESPIAPSPDRSSRPRLRPTIGDKPPSRFLSKFFSAKNIGVPAAIKGRGEERFRSLWLSSKARKAVKLILLSGCLRFQPEMDSAMTRRASVRPLLCVISIHTVASAFLAMPTSPLLAASRAAARQRPMGLNMAVVSLNEARAAHVETHRKQVAAARSLFNAEGSALPRPPQPPAAFADADFLLSPGDSVCVSRRALFSAEECAAVIAEAEAVALADGGWSTTRHKLHPAADMPLSRLPNTCARLGAEMVASLGPLLSARYPGLLPDPRALLSVDAFIVKYATAVGQVIVSKGKIFPILTDFSSCHPGGNPGANLK